MQNWHISNPELKAVENIFESMWAMFWGVLGTDQIQSWMKWIAQWTIIWLCIPGMAHYFITSVSFLSHNIGFAFAKLPRELPNIFILCTSTRGAFATSDRTFVTSKNKQTKNCGKHLVNCGQNACKAIDQWLCTVLVKDNLTPSRETRLSLSSLIPSPWNFSHGDPMSKIRCWSVQCYLNLSYEDISLQVLSITLSFMLTCAAKE